MRYKLAIFDFDGTLADSAAWMFREMNVLAREYGFREVSDEEIQMLRGYNNRDIIRYLRIPAWKLPVIAHQMRRRIFEHADKISLFGGIEAALAQLTAAGIQLAIVTSNAEQNVRKILGDTTAAKIAHYQCGASLFSKAPRINRVVKQSRFAAESAIYIGDEIRDIEAARRAGISCASVTWGYATQEALEQHCPDHVFGTIDCMIATLLSQKL